MKISVIGTGYVGLVTGACLSEFGFNVTCYDINHNKIDMLKNGEMPIYEPGLSDIVNKNVTQNRLFFTNELSEVVKDANVYFLAVCTPTINGKSDLSYLQNAALDLANNIEGYATIVIKSTVPVGTTRKIAKLIRKNNPKANFHIVSNPEFLREGAAINDFLRPDRLIVGFENEISKSIMDKIYRPLYLFETPAVYTSLETAEVIKYASNAFLASKIAFVNELADYCEKVGADVQRVASAVGLDKRIGSKFFHPSPGFGGSCFPKDTEALVQSAKEHNVTLSLVETVIKSNNNRKKNIVNKIINACCGNVKDKNIAVLGLAFKPNTDDIRESPALEIIENLIKLGANVSVFDPQAMKNAQEYFKDKNIKWANNSYDAIKDAKVITIVTEWNEFRSLDLNKVKTLMDCDSKDIPKLVDLRNIYLPEEIINHGIEYYSIGRKDYFLEKDKHVSNVENI